MNRWVCASDRPTPTASPIKAVPSDLLREIPAGIDGISAIDPGLDGYQALLSASDDVLLWSGPAPILADPRDETKRIYDYRGLARNASRLERRSRLIVLEGQQAMPGKGSIAGFKSGLGFGLWLGAIHTAEAFSKVSPTKLLVVSPRAWKSALGLMPSAEEKSEAHEGRNAKQARARLRSLSKRKSIALAQKLYPGIDFRRGSGTGKTKKRAIHDGKCEAVLLAHYGKTVLRLITTPAT